MAGRQVVTEVKLYDMNSAGLYRFLQESSSSILNAEVVKTIFDCCPGRKAVYLTVIFLKAIDRAVVDRTVISIRR